jgi:hypothetical protein
LAKEDAAVMNFKVEKRRDKLFVVLPKDAVSQLGWGHGDILSGTVTDGRLNIARSMTAHDHAMEIARTGMKKYRKTFESLAKS